MKITKLKLSNGLIDAMGDGEVEVEVELHEIYVGRSPILSMLAGTSLSNLTVEQDWAYNELKIQYPELSVNPWTIFPHCHFVGETKDTEVRSSGRDYSKLLGGINFDFSVNVLKDLSDHNVRKEIIRQSGGRWFQSPFKGSDEILCSFTEGYKELCERVNTVSLQQQPFLENFKRRTGISYPDAKKLSSDKTTYWCRYIFEPKLLQRLTYFLDNYPKNTLIHIDQDFYGNITEYILSKGYTNVVTDVNPTCENIDSRVKLATKEDIDDMNPKVNIGNPPYQAPNLNGKKGKGGDNSLYIDFIESSIDRAPEGGLVIKVTPPSAIIKSTILRKPSETLNKMVKYGSLEELDLTVGKYFSVGTYICSWKWIKGKKQGKVKLTTSDGEQMVDIEDLYYLPPQFTELERKLFKKIISNQDGEYLKVVRGKKSQDCTMERFGYPKVQIGGSGVLGFDEKFYKFFTSKLGLWLLDYVRRHDQMIYHNALTGIIIPQNGFNLTNEENQFIESGNWVNHSRSENLQSV